MSKRIGLWTATSLVAGNMIGSGLFLLPATLAVYGGISLYGWLISSVGALSLALVFARLSRIIPAAGGPYAYTRIAFGEFPAFLVAWGYWISVWIGNAGITVAFVSYLTVFFPILESEPILAIMTGWAAIWGLSYVNMRGVQSAGYVQLITTIAKLTPILILTLVGLFYFNGAHFEPFNRSSESDFSAILACATLTLWAFLGLESASIPAGDIDQPEKTIPKATVLGTFIVTGASVLSTTAIMGILPPEVLTETEAPFADAAGLIFGDFGRSMIAFAAVISTFGALNGWILMQAQVPMAASRNRLFPEIFQKTNRFGAPMMGLIISAVLSSALLVMNFTRGLVDTFQFMILLSTLAVLVPYLFGSMALFAPALSSKLTTHEKIPVAMTAIIAFLFSIYAVAGSGEEAVYWGFLLLMIGLPVYVGLKKE